MLLMAVCSPYTETLANPISLAFAWMNDIENSLWETKGEKLAA